MRNDLSNIAGAFMTEIKETTHLKDLWSEVEAQRMAGRVEKSRAQAVEKRPYEKASEQSEDGDGQRQREGPRFHRSARARSTTERY